MGDVTTRLMPKPTTRHKSTPIQVSQTASRSHASSEFGGIVSGRRFHSDSSCIEPGGTVTSFRGVSERPPRTAPRSYHSVGAAITPNWRRAVADPDRDHGKRRRLLRPRSLAIADDDEEIDRRTSPLREPAQAGANVRASATVQLQLRGSEHLLHVVDDSVAAGDDDFGP